MGASSMSESSDRIKFMIEERFAKVALDPAGEAEIPGRPGQCQSTRLRCRRNRCPAASSYGVIRRGRQPAGPRRIWAGDVVLDFGCGAGMDSLLAARRVGPNGRVIGVDMTGPMVEKARANASAIAIGNVEFHQGEAHRLPVGDESVDVVISNGVFNLCLDKPKALAEVFRVLRPGGRLQMADILLDDGVTPEQVERIGRGRTESPVRCGSGRSFRC